MNPPAISATSNTRITIERSAKARRINFWQYAPRKSEQPYMYFDTSRYPPVGGK